MNSTTRLQQRDGVMSTTVGDDLVLLDLEANRYFGMDPVSRRTWELFEEPRTLDQVVDVLVAEYDVTVEECRRDVGDYVDGLVDEGLLIPAP